MEVLGNKLDKDRIFDTFAELVSVDSPSGGEYAMAEKLTDMWERVGVKLEKVPAKKDHGNNAGANEDTEAPNLYAYIKGEIPGPSILLVSHMDTVELAKGRKAIRHEDGSITSDGTTVLGADDGTGLATIYEAVRFLKENNIPHRDVELVFSTSEETYCDGIKKFDFAKIRSDRAYVPDLSGAVGGYAYAAPSILSFTVDIKGRASHAGFDPESGRSAILVAAKAITKLPAGHIDPVTTANVGIISGGAGINIVPEHCQVKGEIRSLHHEKALAVAKEYEEIFKAAAEEYNEIVHAAEMKEKIQQPEETDNKLSGNNDVSADGIVKVDFKLTTHIKAYETDIEHELVKDYEEACKLAGITLAPSKTFGGSDNNILAEHGIPGIVIANAMNDVHTCHEYTHIDDIAKVIVIMINLLTKE